MAARPPPLALLCAAAALWAATAGQGGGGGGGGARQRPHGDPSLPESEPTTKHTRKDTETPTPTSQPTPPKTSTNPAAVSGDPYRSETAGPPRISTATTLLTTARPSPAEWTTVDFPQEIGGGVTGTDGEHVKMPHKETTTQDSQPDSSKPSFSSTPSAGISSTTAAPSRNTPENTTGVSKENVPKGQTGLSQVGAVLLPIVSILLLFGLAGLCYYRKRRHIPRQESIIMEGIPGVERPEEGGPMLSGHGDANDAEPAHEETPMQPSDSATSTG
ncbi:interleukin-15 receptor subunit alpha isoform X2 [Paroedura picta]|uniref:interleukin-15 receptor subunit alpha isoform X2 n=1 Tax=Paroedura picta TaxID=143630 RepID=UPI004055C3CE